jgi:uncharacterized protein
MGIMMDWVWDDTKNAENRRKHGLSFSSAKLVFDDPLALTQIQEYPSKERWTTIGMIGGLCVFVVHTWPDDAPVTESGRIISARRATKHERKAYEEGQIG